METAFEIFAQVQKVEEVDITVEGNEDIDITLLFLLLSNIGAKQAQPLDSVMGFHLKFAVSDDFDYFLLSHNCLPVTLHTHSVFLFYVVNIGESLLHVNVILGRELRFAADLKITERTVKAHLTSVYEKTKTGNRLGLALLINRG
jgi:hypothetical protein